MKTFKFFLVLMLSTAVIVGCKKKAENGANASSSSLTVHEKIAKEMCDCAGDLLPLMEKQKALQAAGDTDGLTALMAEVMPKLEEMGKCAQALETKYKDIDFTDAAEEAKLDAAAEKHCPEMANLK